MGYSKAEENIRYLSKDCVPVFELLPVTRSIPGLRRRKAGKAFTTKVEKAERDFTATTLQCADGRIEVRGIRRGEESRVAGKSCVVATGDYIGGGLQVCSKEQRSPS